MKQTFLYISLRGATARHDVKTDAYFHVFKEGVNKPQRNFLPLFELVYGRNSIPGEFANIGHSEWVGIIAMKIQSTRIPFLSEVFPYGH